jgi:aromatic-L-amino-acid decarboxylase
MRYYRAALARRRTRPLAPSPRPLELSGDVMREMVERAMDRIVQHIETLPDQPAHATRGGKKIARAMREAMPERGAPFERLLRRLFGKVIPTSLNTASPGYLGYVPGGGIFHAAVADLIADATNRYVTVFQAAPALAELESIVIAWFCAMLGLPETGGGLLTTGGSIANLIAVVTARRDRLPPDFMKGVLYVSEEAHHSVRKAAIVAGIMPDRVRVIPVNDRFRMPPAAVEEAIVQDRARGLSPFLLVASAGTTGTGAVDDLEALSGVAAREGLWFHVDAAYGGFFALTARGRAALRGIERADSVTLDPHKSLFLPYGTGCILARDRDALRRAHSVHASYMPPMESDLDLVDFCELGPELSREARGLRVWLPLKMHGAAVFRDTLDEKLDLARYAVERLRGMRDIEVVAEPELSLLAFRARPPAVEEGEALDIYNRTILARVNARQRVFMTGVTARGRFILRMCILSFRTHADRVEAALEDIEASLKECAREIRSD